MRHLQAVEVTMPPSEVYLGCGASGAISLGCWQNFDLSFTEGLEIDAALVAPSEAGGLIQPIAESAC